MSTMEQLFAKLIKGLHSLKATACISVCIVILSSASCSRDKEVGVNPGDLAPNPVLSDLQGHPRRILDYVGSPTVLNFWTSWCAPCVEEMPALEQLHQALKEKGGAVIGVAVKDDLEAVKRFVNEKGVTFPVLFDRDGVTRQKYKLSGFPESFILNGDGKVQMIPDFSDGSPVVKIVGPRSWASAQVISQLLQTTKK